MRQLMQHQRRGRAFKSIAINRCGGYGCFFAPGTGKTLLQIRTAKLPCLVICRRDDFQTWKNELEEEGYAESQSYFVDGIPSSPKDLPTDLYHEGIDWVFITYDLVKPLHIPKRDKETGLVIRNTVEEIFQDEEGNETIESRIKTEMKLSRVLFEWLKQTYFAEVALDECDYIKHHDSARTQYVIKATRHIPRRVAMTGTPITNDISDIFSQALFIDNGKTFGRNFFAFRQKYYIKDEKLPKWYPKRTAKADITRLMANFSVHVHEDDVLKLPPAASIVKGVPMDKAQIEQYVSVLDDWEIKLQNGDYYELNLVIEQLEKLRQIAAGYYYNPTDPERKPVWIGWNKIQLLQKLVGPKGELADKKKIVIWAARTAEVEKIAEILFMQHLGDPVMFYGGQSPKVNNEARTIFKTDPNCRFFVGQVDKGRGLNELIVADTAIYASNSLRVSARQQSERRTRRKGSEIHKRCLYYDLVSEGSVDLKILRNVKRSMSVAQSVLDELKAGKRLREILKFAV